VSGERLSEQHVNWFNWYVSVTVTDQKRQLKVVSQTKFNFNEISWRSFVKIYPWNFNESILVKWNLQFVVWGWQTEWLSTFEISMLLLCLPLDQKHAINTLLRLKDKFVPFFFSREKQFLFSMLFGVTKSQH